MKSKEGDGLVYGQGSDSDSISSSDEEELQARADNPDSHLKTKPEKAFDAFEHPKDGFRNVFETRGKREREEREERGDGGKNSSSGLADELFEKDQGDPSVSEKGN